jgi:cytochrome oxidase assembly protein ShyY1
MPAKLAVLVLVVAAGVVVWGAWQMRRKQRLRRLREARDARRAREEQIWRETLGRK